jgi:hypothetical protein
MRRSLAIIAWLAVGASAHAAKPAKASAHRAAPVEKPPSLPAHWGFASNDPPHPFARYPETREQTVSRILEELGLSWKQPHTYLELKQRIDQLKETLPQHRAHLESALDYLEKHAFREEALRPNRETLSIRLIGAEPVGDLRTTAGTLHFARSRQGVNTGSVTTHWYGLPTDKRVEIDEMIDGFMRESYLSSGYLDSEVTEMLEAERKLPLNRSLYYAQFKDNTEPALLCRLFDGSSSFRRGVARDRQRLRPIRLHDTGSKPVDLPLEKKYGVHLPEKFKAEIGRLAKDPLVPGFESALFAFALALADAHPGPNGEGIRPDLVISVSARLGAAKNFRRYGFVERDPSEQPAERPDIRILKIDGAEFWRRFGDGKAPTDFWPSRRVEPASKP